MKFPRSPLSAKHMASLCRRLAYMCRGGIPAIRMFELIAQEPGSRRIKGLALSIVDDLRCGHSLGEALQARKEHFSPVFVELVSMAERTGKLDTVMTDLAEWYETEVELKRRFVKAFAYPLAVIVVARYFLIPLAAVFLAGKPSGQLFWATYAFAKDLAVLVVLWKIGFLNWFWANLGSRIPPFGRPSRQIAMSRFCEALAVMLGSGMSVRTSIKTAAKVPGRPFLEKELLTAIPRIERGATIDEAFADCPSLPPLVRGMISVGEQTGELEQSLQKARHYMKDEAIHGLKVLAKTIVTLVIIIGVLMGGLQLVIGLPIRW